MKLHVEMVPQPIWGMNLRSKGGLGRYRWEKLRKSILAERGPTCVICASADQPHGHEVWKYEEKRRTGIAKLLRVEIICRDCHSIHHWGVATRLALQGLLPLDDLRRLIKHACNINGCTPRQFKRHADDAMAVWERRSALRWTIDWGPYHEDVRLAREAREQISQKRTAT
jgi:hypothetical protein